MEEGRSVELTVVDFSEQDVDLTVNVNLSEASRAIVKVASICRGKETKVFSINVYHNGGRSYSRTTMAGINQGDGTLRFLGTSYIKNGAHKSDTRQEGKVTNLSLKSRSEVSPALLINDNDVKASHGAALGAYDPQAIYYLMSRGLTESQSKKLITVGNIVPIIDSFNDKKLVEKARSVLGGMGF